MQSVTELSLTRKESRRWVPLELRNSSARPIRTRHPNGRVRSEVAPGAGVSVPATGKPVPSWQNKTEPRRPETRGDRPGWRKATAGAAGRIVKQVEIASD